MILGVLFLHQTANFPLQQGNILGSLLNTRAELARLTHPALAVGNGLVSAAEFLFDFLAIGALVWEVNGGVEEFHAAGLANAVLAVAVLFEVAPFPVAAGELVAFVETHDELLGWEFPDVGWSLGLAACVCSSVLGVTICVDGQCWICRSFALD